MSTKKKPTKKPVAKIDPRLHMLGRLVDDLTAMTERGDGSVPLVMETVFEAFDWQNINAEALKLALETLFEAHDEKGKAAIAEVVASEHRHVCSCCARRHEEETAATKRGEVLFSALQRASKRIDDKSGRAVRS